MVTIYKKNNELDKVRTLRSLLRYVLMEWVHGHRADKVLVSSSEVDLGTF